MVTLPKSSKSETHPIFFAVGKVMHVDLVSFHQIFLRTMDARGATLPSNWFWILAQPYFTHPLIMPRLVYRFYPRTRILK